ncbi:MAG: diguanylate cyclase, partial [Bryobacteraceae bacterium]|nr:diguanylate cyclase [Bryobacteraceae bacterium]
PNWSHILQTETAERASILISEVHSRLNESLGADTFAGRWYDGYLTALVPLDKRAAMDASDELVRQLSGRYPVPDGASTKMLQISVRIAVLDHFKGQTAEHLLKRVDQLIRAFEQR